MSIVNLTGNILTPDYPKAYLIHSEIIDEARRRPGARFEGIVGTIEENIDGAFHQAVDRSAHHAANRATDHASEAVFDVDLEGHTFFLHRGKSERVRIDSSNPYWTPGKPQNPSITIASGPMYSVKENYWNNFTILASIIFLVGCIAIAINANLTLFEPASSNLAQRMFTMLWLA